VYTVGAVADHSSATGSFEQLAMPLFASLYNFAFWLAQDQAAAEDLVQETYMKALKGFSSFEQGSNFRAWIYRILRNTFMTSQAGLKAAAFVSLDGDDESPADPGMEIGTYVTPESLLLARIERQAIQQALQELPVAFREVILLCDMEEMSYHEIGLALGIPIGTVMSRVSRARRAMRKLLAASIEGAAQ
jgi:RNA polymerase sigma-70 factor (ECF subfamily)